MKPWLIEVNSSPAMSMDNNIDYQIKPDLIKDIIKLLDFEPYEEYLVIILLLLILCHRRNQRKKLPLSK